MECVKCGSIVNPADSICRVCGSPIQKSMQNSSSNINNQNINMQNGFQMIKPYDFICPHCGIRIPENQLYQFIQRNQPMPINFNNMNYNTNNINHNGFTNNFSNMDGIVNNKTASSNNIYNKFPNNNGAF